MNNLFKSILIIIFLSLLQLLIYNFYLKPIITTWGATENEVAMPMAGDDKNLIITSTRAILINAPQAEVWQWLIQLGADRGGFYSYDFIERMLGYHTRHQDTIKPDFNEIKVGEIIRGSINEERSIIPYNFKVLYVKPIDTFVLDKWGTFLLIKVNDQQTRLIIRSQESKTSSPWVKIANYIAVPLHFIMERRTLMGIKERAETGAGQKLSQTQDIVWFSGIVLSGFLICFFVFIGRGILQSIIITSVYSTFWVFSIFLFDPIPLFSIGLLIIICVTIIRILLINKTSRKLI
ncbi:MAG: hypothetical protein ABSF18_05050 [Gammaproteobacteria bacterium]|jgi:hypothetical protein